MASWPTHRARKDERRARLASQRRRRWFEKRGVVQSTKRRDRVLPDPVAPETWAYVHG